MSLHAVDMHVRSLSESVPVDVAKTTRIVVAFDDSASAPGVLAWAALEARVRQSTLTVVDWPTVPSDVHRPGIGADKRDRLASVVDDLRREHDDLCIDVVNTRVSPHDALLVEAIGAELLIVGASASVTGRRWLSSSAPGTGARRSACPVVVVRGGHRRAMRNIVVGVDGSNAAAAALDWAIDEADLHIADLELVHAWQHYSGTDRSIRRNDLRQADAACVVDVAVRYCKQRTTRPVRGSVREGEAKVVLAAASDDGDLLVVGSRGRSGFKTMLFGSVALSVVDHAGCPVVVIHPHLR